MTKAPAVQFQQYFIFCAISDFLQKAFKSICSVEIEDNVCHVVDRSSYLAYTVLLWQDDQADRFKVGVIRINLISTSDRINHRALRVIHLVFKYGSKEVQNVCLQKHNLD